MSSSSQNHPTNNNEETAAAEQESGSGKVKDKSPEPGAGPSSDPSIFNGCPICLMPLDDPVITDCGHVYCFGCLSEMVRRSVTYPRCPMCRRYL